MAENTMENKLPVAIGKIICETQGVPWNIPHTHFMVNQTSSGLFEATNIELVLDSVGASIDEAARILMRLTADYVKEVMIKGRGHDELIEMVDSNAMENYWREYRKAEVELSRTGQDMGHKLDRYFIEAVKETWEDDFRDIIYKVAKHDAEEVLTALRGKIPSAKIAVSAEYREFKAA
ncbi:MAG: hypothetical protein LBC52_03725 [Treponema sp.]|jgi:hypothetical protein|nr:hypothetical protein [Treponema sp.]